MALLIAIVMIASIIGIGQVIADGQQSQNDTASNDTSTNNTVINNTLQPPANSTMTLSLERHVYYPADSVNFYIYNATTPQVSVIDPSGTSHNITLQIVNDSAYTGEYVLNSGIVLSNYTVEATDEANGATAVDQFEVTSRPVSATPTTVLPSNNTTVTPLYLNLNISKSEYRAGDSAGFTVMTNFGTPMLAVKDPAGKTTMVDLTRVQNNTYIGAYPLEQAVIIGNYSVMAAVNANGAYSTTTGYFNVTLGQSMDQNGLNVELVAYDPVQNAFVMKASMASNDTDTPETAASDTPGIKELAVKGVKVMQASAPGMNNGIKQATKDKQVEVIIPADDNSMKTLGQRYNLSKDIAKATMTNSVSADGTRVHLSLNNKVDGSWYRLSASIPAGYSVSSIIRADGTPITNDVTVDRATGAIIKNNVNWYVDNNTLYFYDDPINGYDITLVPPMASNSLAVNVINGGQLSAIIYPFNQTDSDAVMTSHDQLGRDGDNSYAYDIDADAGSKTAVRLYQNNNVNSGLRIFGNDGYRYPTYSATAYQYTDVGQPTTVGFNTVPDGSVESVVLSNYTTPMAGTVVSSVTITQKTIIRNNNLWFATVYYINNTGASDLNGFRFYEGSDFNFNGQFSNDDDYYDTVNDTVYGHYNNGNANAIQTAGFRSTIQSSRHDVAQYGNMWQRIAGDTLQNGTSTNGIDAGAALAWDYGTLKKSTTWVVPVIWAVGQNNTVFSNTMSYAISHNVFDVGIESIDNPVNGDSLDSLTMPIVAINATAMDVGVTDQSPTVLVSVKDASGNTVYSNTTTVNLSIPYAETAPVSFGWNLASVQPGNYTINVSTQLLNANGNNMDQNSSNDLKSITVYVRNFTVYPDQWGHVNAGDNPIYNLTLANMGTSRSFDISVSGSTAHWPTYLYYNNTATPLAQDYDGDGMWDWVNSTYKDPATGLPYVAVLSGMNSSLLLQKLVPPTADPGVLDTTVLAVNPVGEPATTSTAIIKTDTPLATLVGKTFYMHALNLNTTPDTAASNSKAVTAIFAMWSQTPAFADNFMINGSLLIPFYYTTSVAMPITATLFYTNGAASTTLIGSTTATLPVAATTPGLYNFTIIPSGKNIVVPRGSYLVLKIDNQQMTTLNVFYDNTRRTRVQVNTSTYVHVGAINTYNGTTVTSNFGPAATVHVTANVSDPIGSYDIPRANITITAPNGTLLVNNQAMTFNKSDQANPSLWKIFDYNYTLGSSLPAGVYTVTITGYESNGVTHTKTSSITLMSTTPALLIYPSNTKATSPGTVVKLKHTVTNLNSYRSDVVDITDASPLSGWTLKLFMADGITPLPDTDGDGVPDTGSLAALGSTDIVVQVTVPSYANTGDVDKISVVAHSSNNVSVTSTASDTVFISATSVVKTLYLHDMSTGPYLNTFSATSAIDHIDLAAGSGTDWTQTPVFARNFNILDDPIVTLYVNSADTQASMTLKLISSNSTGSSTIASLNYTVAVTKNTLTQLNFNIPLSGLNVTIPAGNKLMLHIDNLNDNQLTVYGSAQNPSRIDMDTQSYINVQSVSITDSANNAITSVTPPIAIKVISNVTDPFGSQDITNATLTIKDGSGNTVGSPYVMTQAGIDAGSPSLWKKFESDITLPTTMDTGNYSFVVTATETNGVINNMAGSLAIVYPVNVTADKSFAPLGSDSFFVTIKVTNNNIHTVNGIHAYDFYSGSFTASGFNVARSSFAINNGILSGTINIMGPLSLAPGETKTITYTAVGSGDYHISDMYVVGVDPYV